MASPSNSHSRLAALPSESVLPPPRDPVSLGEPTDQPLKSNTIPRATGLVRSYPQLVKKLSPPTPVNDGKPSSPLENFPIRESHLLANQAAWRDGLSMTLPYDLEIHIALANAENNIKNEWLEQGVGETIGVVEHSDIEGPKLAEQAHAINKDFRIEKNLRDKKRDSAPEMEWALGSQRRRRENKLRRKWRCEQSTCPASHDHTVLVMPPLATTAQLKATMLTTVLLTTNSKRRNKFRLQRSTTQVQVEHQTSRNTLR